MTPPRPTLPVYLTTAEAAVYLRAGNASTVRSWVARGLLKPDGRRGPGGPLLFLSTTLDAFAATSLQGTDHAKAGEDRKSVV